MQRISGSNSTSKDGGSFKRLCRQVGWIMLNTDEAKGLANWIQNWKNLQRKSKAR